MTTLDPKIVLENPEFFDFRLGTIIDPDQPVVVYDENVVIPQNVQTLESIQNIAEPNGLTTGSILVYNLSKQLWEATNKLDGGTY